MHHVSIHKSLGSKGNSLLNATQGRGLKVKTGVKAGPKGKLQVTWKTEEG